MPFQFQCPQGHLLEGEPSQAGQQCVCPMCGMLFLIPQPVVAPEAPQYAFNPAGAGGPPQPSGPAFDPNQPQEPELLHIPCPNGHELETPVEMLDQEVLCPQCQVQFRLRKRDSVEFKKKKEEQDRLREIKLGNAWLNWAIAAAVLVGIGLVGLIIASQLGRTPVQP